MSAALMRIETGGGLGGGLDRILKKNGDGVDFVPRRETESRKAQSRQNRRINSRRAL